MWGCRCGRTAYHGDGRADRGTGAASIVRSNVCDRLALRNPGVTSVVCNYWRVTKYDVSKTRCMMLDIMAADARGYDGWPKGYGVNASLGPLLPVAVIVLMRSNARAG